MHRLTINSKEGDTFRFCDLKAYVVKRFNDKDREYVVFRQWMPFKRYWRYYVEPLDHAIRMSNISR